MPTGFHNGRTIFYVFGRYPKDEEDDYPVVDLVICHGDFLNADHEYKHANKNIKGFGTYGDIMIRDRKMYVAPTPFALLEGVIGQRVLILPEGAPADTRLREAGIVERVECEKLIVGYTFDLKTNELRPELTENPGAGRAHRFKVYRMPDAEGPAVKMKTHPTLPDDESA